MDYHKLLLEHLDLVDRVARYIARRHHLSDADTDEFLSLVRFKLIDGDCAILRKFQGRSNLATYLTTVIERLYLDACRAEHGKWRPSSSAERLGRVAVLLERLLERERLTFDQAVVTLQTNHGVTATRDELQAILRQLPRRTACRLASAEELALVASRAGAPDRALDREDDLQIAERVEAALSKLVAALAVREQVILKLRYQDGLSVPQIGRVLHIADRSLYRRLQAMIASLREKFRQEGIDAKDIDRIVGHPAIRLGRILDPSFDGAGQEILADPEDGSV